MSYYLPVIHGKVIIITILIMTGVIWKKRPKCVCMLHYSLKQWHIESSESLTIRSGNTNFTGMIPAGDASILGRYQGLLSPQRSSASHLQLGFSRGVGHNCTG